jgi:hypothetical protein
LSCCYSNRSALSFLTERQHLCVYELSNATILHSHSLQDDLSTVVTVLGGLFQEACYQQADKDDDAKVEPYIAEQSLHEVGAHLVRLLRMPTSSDKLYSLVELLVFVLELAEVGKSRPIEWQCAAGGARLGWQPSQR